jgi:hypothetical protein
MVSLIDFTKPIYGEPTTQSVRDNFQIANQEITDIQNLLTGDLGFISQGDADLRYLQLIGGVLTGDLNGAGVYGTSVSSSGNVNATGVFTGGSVDVTGNVRSGSSLMVASGITFVADNYAYYSGRSSSDGVWRWVQNNAELMSLDTAGSLHAIGNMWCNAGLWCYGSLLAYSGRILSQAGANNVSVTCYDTSLGYAAGMCVQSGNAAGLFFGAMDGNGNVAAWLGYIAAGSIGCNNASAAFCNYNGAYSLLWGDQTAMTVPGAAWKPGGGSWADSSDLRIKNVIGDYTSGLEAILALRPIRYNLKGNWSYIEGRNAEVSRDKKPAIQAPHDIAAEAGTEFIGFVAQELETIMPEMVNKIPAKIDGKLVDDLRTVDITALPFALVNAIKEINARLTGLEARV